MFVAIEGECSGSEDQRVQSVGVCVGGDNDHIVAGLFNNRI